MRKLWLTLAACLLGSSLTVGYETDIRNETAAESAVSQAESSGLAPRRPQTITRGQYTPQRDSYIPDAPRLAQADPVPMVETEYFLPAEPANGSNGAYGTTGTNDAYIFAELDRISDELQQIKKDTAKPDTKKSFSAPKLGGRLFFDAWASPDIPNKAGMNELRFAITGTGYEVFDYKVELSVTSAAAASSGHTHPVSGSVPVEQDHTHTLGAPSATTYIGQLTLVDAWIGAKNLPGFGYLRVGHFNVENGINRLTGTNHTTLATAHPSTDSFHLARKFGISSEHLFANDRVRWFAGIFQGYNINNGYNSSARAYSGNEPGLIFNTRLTMAPYYADGGRSVLHIGGHYSYIHDSNQHDQITTFNGANTWLGNNLTTGRTGVMHHNRGGLEWAYQYGPFRAQAEAFVAHFGDAGTASGVTNEVSYFLTGEHRAYNLATATWGAATVKRPFRPFQCGDWNLVDGWGAWQVAARHAYTDLGDWATGGYQNDWTFGMNWFWTPNVRWVFEYTHSTWNGGAGYMDVYGTSFRVNF